MCAAPKLQGRPVDLGGEIVAEFLSSTRLFQGAEQGLSDKVAPHVQAVGLSSGTDIVQAGTAIGFVGVLFSGRASIRMVNAVSGESMVQRELQVGDSFGLEAALLGSAQPTKVVAEDDCVVLVVHDSIFQQLCSRAPGFAHGLAKRLAARLVQQGAHSSAPAAPAAVAAPEPLGAPAPAAAVPAGGIPFVRSSDYEIGDKLLELVPAESMLQHRFLPLRLQGSKLTVGMVDPFHHGATEELERVLHGIELDVVALSQDDYMHALVRLRLDLSSLSGGPKGPLTADQLSYEKEDQEREAESALGVLGDEIVGLVDRIIATGIQAGASDVHIEEQRAEVKVRYRIHGMLQDWNEYIPASFAKGLVARIKILAGLDITERRRPQDGRIGLKAGRRDIDYRVSLLPASRGEKVVMRMFEAATMMRPLEQVFMDPATLAVVREVLERPYGAIIVAGPTGSGKSSTLYGCLNERRTSRPDTNICLVEDPIEYRLQGVTQVQVNHAVGLTFSTALRSFLRQDPDVIMVGEIRDPDTAQIALEAAMTGHLVLSSFHANDAMAAIQRLENLGCSRTMVAQSVAAVLVQRLVRRLCPHCVVQAEAPPVLLKSLVERGLVEDAAMVPVPKAPGCERCDQTGFGGRVAVLEALKVTDEVRAALMAGQPLHDIRAHALANGLLTPFRRYASLLMTRRIIGPGDALLAVAG